MTSFRAVYWGVGLLVLAASLHISAAAGAETPPAYAFERRYFYGQPDDPNPIAKIYVSGDWHRLENYVDGKLRWVQISRPDRNVVYLIVESDRTYKETPFEELRAQGWSPGGGFSLAGYQERAQKGKLVLTLLGSETVKGQVCEKYSIDYRKGLAPFYFWVSSATGLPVLYTYEKTRIEWSNLNIGPQPRELFEPPRGYRKVHH
jgi:hypothetical protein